MRQVSSKLISAKVKDLCLRAATDLGPDIQDALKAALKKEESPLGRDILTQIITNFEIAANEKKPMCQDTGLAVFFVELGREVELDGLLDEAIDEGVRQGYEEGFLRKSLCDPFTRKNTGDNTPSVIHTTIVEGSSIKISMAPKGGGSENMSALKMLKPSDGLEGIKKFVIETIKTGGGNPCPPIIVGVGIGGNFEKSAILAKKALMRELGHSNPDPVLAALEGDLAVGVNNLGIGPMGFGGVTTALGVHVEAAPCHIASLPVSVNIQCHAARHKEVTI
ncbi:Fumarate hydratase class I, alpha region; L(+)-tartrate dehydratase alpha subunit [hydrothermal vent metagenome]|uniref:Fumarate hydratase class I, alpha region L(+)-tartrate dehydratase alpha subunit n=1 Tax=hydrothermal vent metagenome TaxID=652676 RepID=A0A3B0W1D2_9ZZZZ